jgi:hypothetical protein
MNTAALQVQNLPKTDADEAYVAFLRVGTHKAMADARPALHTSDAKKHMDTVKASQQARLDDALRSKGVRA